MKTLSAVLIALMSMIMLVACTNFENVSNETTIPAVETSAEQLETEVPATIEETELPGEHYEKFLSLIEEKNFEAAYNELDNIKDKKVAEDLRKKFTVIENVLISKTVDIPEDDLGNKPEPNVIKYIYDKSGKIVAIDAINYDLSVDPRVVNHYLEYVQLVNYLPEYEELIYDENGKLTKVTGYSSKDKEKIRYTAEFIYNESGLNTQVKYNLSNGYMLTEFEYDEQGNKTLAKYSGNAVIIPAVYRTKLIHCDEYGTDIECSAEYNANGTISKTKCSYDGKDCVCEWNYGNFYIYEE